MTTIADPKAPRPPKPRPARLTTRGNTELYGWVFKWASPFWQVWDLLMLWLAMIHGTNGVRTIINDYAERDGVRLALKSALYLAFVVVVVLGTLVIFTFDPCPSGAPADLLPSFCTA
jgi:succinate dehydrogenase / fumarate reductase membrane anchor subunit